MKKLVLITVATLTIIYFLFSTTSNISEAGKRIEVRPNQCNVAYDILKG